MKTLQKSRLVVQILALILTVVGFWMNVPVAKMVIMLSTFLVGVFYCGWICPFGTLQDLFAKLGSLLKIKKRKMPKKLQNIFKYFRYLVLAAVMLITIDFIFTIMMNDPRSNFESILLGRMSSISALVVVFVFLIVSLFFERPFCNYFCQEGAKYGLMSYFRIFRIKRNETSCVSCRKCDKVCPMNIEISTTPSVTSAQCINCLECVSACPVAKTLEYKPAKQRFTIKSAAVLLAIAGIVASMTMSDVRRGEESGSEEVISQSSEIDDNSLNLGAQSETAEFEFADGEFIGEAKGFKGIVEVSVTVDNHIITNVEVVSHNDDQRWFDRANNSIPDLIVDAQSTDVDTVSGATYSSLGIINAVKDALDK